MNKKRTSQFAIKFDNGYYYAESLDIRVVTHGETLDELIGNLREAVALHLEGEDLSALGITPDPALRVYYEVDLYDISNPPTKQWNGYGKYRKKWPKIWRVWPHKREPVITPKKLVNYSRKSQPQGKKRFLNKTDD